MDLRQKLNILGEAAKYDVSCSSSGSSRRAPKGGLGSGCSAGICHTWSADGRCISLLKVLLSNACKYDCAYCINRRSNDVPRATFTPRELIDLTLEFYRRNYIEGLFLSSAVIGSPDNTMELLIRVAKELRTMHRFGGYIHLKAIPGASDRLLYEAGLYADRSSVNIEIPSDRQLQYLAPEKNFASIYRPMNFLAERKIEYKTERSNGSRFAPKFLPAGQSTQMIVGASGETDLQILTLSAGFYRQQQMKRVYFSGYVPINADKRLPALTTKTPLLREHRLYQADWLMRFYKFNYDEILDAKNPNLDLDLDPKAMWALRHPEFFPIDLQTADYEMILRVPGIGVKSAQLIVSGRRFCTIRMEQLKKMGVVLKRAKYFIYNPDVPANLRRLYPEMLRPMLIARPRPAQLDFFSQLQTPALPAPAQLRVAG
ncbi:putative DNA modification/repair radical SAM protein [Fibrobacter sp. UWP2]|uniref:putative DNA modification/repair radical SAM protein n=1 Tax=Fibrobacter sp. UWP2 TaxID=1896216 RepID=UPI000922DEAF|nr:putative DNA modification/repair radical SAM protein [Fibrobacter sp. UWP2]SHI61344.1 putative DNA modification/repair radical SAM protein [Fibrobacter sp. UWP2]